MPSFTPVFGTRSPRASGSPIRWARSFPSLGAAITTRRWAAGPKRNFYSFPGLVDPSELAPIKVWTNELELSFSSEGRRLFNLDPGLLFLTRFVLATTKDRPQRIPLSLGIYAELTLIYENDEYRPLRWTYPDWASEDYRAFLKELRERLKADLRRLGF
jgi:hypothetical protein